MKAVALLLVLLMSGPILADSLRLKDGRTLTGTLHRTEGGWTVVDAYGQYSVTDAEVAGVDLAGQPPEPVRRVLPPPGSQLPPPTPRPAAIPANAPVDAAPSPALPATDDATAADGDATGVPAAPSAGLESLRRVCKTLDDPADALSRYERFVQQVRGTPVEVDARADMAVWQQRHDQGLVRLADQWVTPEQRAESRGQQLATLGPAREAIRTGDFATAEPLLDQVLAADPTNPSAWYLRGLIYAQRQDVPRTRKAFEAVLREMPDHGPSHNNLAVTLYRQNQTGPAMLEYLAAMNASPTESAILDNVSEAMQSLPPVVAKGTAGKRVLERFRVLDTALAQQMAAQGMIRWGATWITTEQLRQYQQTEQEVKSSLDAMAVQFTQAEQEVARIDGQIQSNQRRIADIESTSFVRDAFGRAIRAPYPAYYYELVDENNRLAVDRVNDEGLLDQLRQAADAERRKIPAPVYTGEQKYIGVEGTPARMD